LCVERIAVTLCQWLDYSYDSNGPRGPGASPAT
jgi:hypothetical protein